MRILLSAYACEPGRGSEPGVGWRWGLELARMGHRVTVLTQAKNRAAIDAAAARGGLPPGLDFAYHAPPAWIRALKGRVLPLQLYHLVWQVGAVAAARASIKGEAFDLVHHLTFCTIRQPSLLGRLGLPFVLGPLGGGERAPLPLRSGFGWRGHITETMRDLANALLRIDPITRRALADARVIWVTSEETRALVPACHRERTRIALQIGIDAPMDAEPPVGTAGDPKDTLQLLFVGRFLHWKGMDLGLHALAQLVERGVPVRLTMVGEGPEGTRWRRRATRLGIADHVDWLPWLTRDTLGELYRAHHLLLFPSLHDSAGMVVLESLAHGLPVVCLDRGGPGRIVDRRCGRRIATEGRSAAAVRTALAEALADIADDPALLEDLRAGALTRARDFAWPRVVASMMAETRRAIGIEQATPTTTTVTADG